MDAAQVVNEMLEWHTQEIERLKKEVEHLGDEDGAALEFTAEIGVHQAAVLEIARRSGLPPTVKAPLAAAKPAHVPQKTFKWRLLFRVPQEHYFWFDEESRRFAISDESANGHTPGALGRIGLPQHTDDGVLWLTGEAKVGVNDGKAYLRFPVICDRDGESSAVWETFEKGICAAAALQVGNPAFRLLIAEDAPLWLQMLHCGASNPELLGRAPEELLVSNGQGRLVRRGTELPLPVAIELAQADKLIKED